MAAYCTTGDLLNGNIPLPDYVNSQKYVNDAADEIDSMIGFVYQTPIDISDSGAVLRPARLLLKRINAHLATGRLIMALDAGGENDRLHAYGYSLVEQALVALQAIADGEILIEGALTVDTGDKAQVTAVIVLNEDAESNVSAFYDRVMSPGYFGTLEAERLLPPARGLGVVR